jgi:hypothetical protein
MLDVLVCICDSMGLGINDLIMIFIVTIIIIIFKLVQFTLLLLVIRVDRKPIINLFKILNIFYE